MLWYKAWLDTRWRFLIGLTLLACSAAVIVFTYPKVMQLMPLVPPAGAGGEIGQRIREAAELSRNYRGYVWSQWFQQSVTQMGTLFAALLGSGGLVAQGSAGASLFTLSLPASRNRLLGVRAAAGLGEWLVVAVVPCLVLAALSPAIGQRYALGEAVTHGICLFVAGAVFFSLALLMSTVFTDPWRPLLLALFAAMALAVSEQALRGVLHHGIFSVMSGEAYFRTGQPPWGGLFVSAAAAGALLYSAAMNFARRDF
jgi:hypothetical protein